jgi:hypothetical protein
MLDVDKRLIYRLCFAQYIELEEFVSIFWQGAEYEEFVKAAITDNEVQFVETNDKSVAKILFPDITSEEGFLGLVKNEPEKFEKFGKYLVHIFECFMFPLTVL